MRFRVIDIETTGLMPPAEVIEIGCVDVVVEDGVTRIEAPRAQLFRPLHGISPETMAVVRLGSFQVTARLPPPPPSFRRASGGISNGIR